jgi:5'-3' exonuclease
MGLSGFLSFIKKKVPNVIHKEHISIYAYQRVFIDISGYIYRYMYSYGKEKHRWIAAVIELLYSFKDNKVIPVPVFDGKPPSEKNEELKERKQKRDTLSSRSANLSYALEEYKKRNKDSSITSILLEELARLDRRGQRIVSLLSSSRSERISVNDIDQLEQVLNNITRQCIHVTEEDINNLKEVLTAVGINWLQSPSESETYCSFLIRNNLGSALVSCDSDCLAHLVPDLIINIDPSGYCSRIELDQLLEELSITKSQMVDYAILMGCDYNKHIKNSNIGPVKALKLIEQYQTIENIPSSVLDKDLLLYEKCRELFQESFDKDIIFSIPSISINSLKEIVNRLKMDFSLFKCVINFDINKESKMMLKFEEE